MSENRKIETTPDGGLSSTALLAALEEIVKSERHWEDILLCYDEEDGFWISTVERGRSYKYPTHELDLASRRATLAEAIKAAVDWHNKDAQRPYSEKIPISSANG